MARWARKADTARLGASDDIDIWRTANLLVKLHGRDAVLVSAAQCDAMLDRGDLDGREVWRRIHAAVKTLEDPAPQVTRH